MILSSKRPPSASLDISGRDFTRQLYQDYQALMYATALKYVSDPHAAEDIVQDGLVRLMQKVELLQTLEEYRLAGYVAATVRNTAFNYLKHQGIVGQHTAGETDLTETAAEELPLDEMLILAERSRDLLRIWPRLTPEEQQLLEGKYILGDSDAELAAQFCCKTASIRMKLTRARRKALRLMTDEKGDDQP